MDSKLAAAETQGLKDCGYLLQITCRRRLLSASHSHDFYEIVYLIEGQCTEVINEIPYSLCQDHVTILRPGDSHAFAMQSEDANLLALSVVESEVQRFIEAYGESLRRILAPTARPPVYTLNASQRLELMSEYERVATINDDRKIVHYKIILGKLIHFLLSYSEVLSGESPKNLFLTKINGIHTFENIAEGVPALIRLSNFSPAQLGRLMQKYMGTTPHRYIFALRMNMAHELIRNSTLSLETISEKVGYASFSHFNQAFKRAFGISSAKLRKQSSIKTI